MHEDAARNARKKRNGMKSNKLNRTRTFIASLWCIGVVTVMERKHVELLDAWTPMTSLARGQLLNRAPGVNNNGSTHSTHSIGILPIQR
jgi:hypothetical protein